MPVVECRWKIENSFYIFYDPFVYAGVVELVDSVDLGAVTLVKGFRFSRPQKLNMRV